MAILRSALFLLIVAAGCFSPNRPPCAFSCVDDGICPTGYSCQADGICHRDDGQGVCVIPPLTDGGQDAGGDDGNTDAGAGDATDGAAAGG